MLRSMAEHIQPVLRRIPSTDKGLLRKRTSWQLENRGLYDDFRSPSLSISVEGVRRMQHDQNGQGKRVFFGQAVDRRITEDRTAHSAR